jgi:hypothetical protein
VEKNGKMKQQRNTKRSRKRSGRVIARIIKPAMKWEDVYSGWEYNLEPKSFWDDWRDKKRDGFRDKKGLAWKIRDKKKVLKRLSKLVSHER